MDRDPKFEIQFLISLSIASFGFLTASSIKPLLDVWLGFLFLLAIFLHILLFSVAYTYNSVSGFDLNIAKRLRKMSEITFGVVTAMFLLVLLHVVFNSTLAVTGKCANSAQMLDILGVSVGCSSATTFLSYIVPILITVTMGLPFANRILSSFRALSDIDIAVVPEEVHVYPDLEETEPVFAKIANKSDSTEEFDIKVRPPQSVSWKKNHSETGTGDIEESATIQPQHRYKLDLQLAYDGNHRRSDMLEIEFSHESGTQIREVELLLDPVA